MKTRLAVFTLCTLLSSFCLAQTAPAHHLFFHVQLPKDHAATSGRLLVFIQPDAEAKKEAGTDGKVKEVQLSEFHPEGGNVAAREVSYLAPGATADIDVDSALTFPGGFSQLPAGDYDVQAVLDVNHDYNYRERTPGDLLSGVAAVHLDASTADGPTMTLVETVPERDPWKPFFKPDTPERQKMYDHVVAQLAALKPHVELVDFVSPSLTAFWGRETHIRGWALLPPGYREHTTERYPTVYFTHGYGASLNGLLGYAAAFDEAMTKGEMPPMIWILLDESLPGGTHEFADSVNNGPWGHALTTEFIPYFEGIYRTDGKPSSRFLNGHSSGGWATLWLQTRYPAVFGGTWSTSPDPSDFHDFTGVDLYALHANVYYKADGSLYPIMRDKGKVVANIKTFAQLEAVLGPYGGQFESFEWVFSPRGKDGRPEPMFNRATGDVDPAVVEYWHEHYDIAHLVKENWLQLKPDLDGKVHLIVGTADTFYLDGAAHRLQAVMDGLGAKSDFRYLPGKTHFDLYTIGDDRMGLFKQIAWEMYAQARPGSKRPN